VPARVVAAALRERLPGVGVKKLHKLLYYCQGHHLATFGQPLFDETVSAWDMGPVVGSLWYEEKLAGLRHETVSPGLGEAELNTLGYVLSRYGRLSGRDLEVLSHAEDPWQRANQHRRPGESTRIEPEWMRVFFATGQDDDDLALDSEAVSAWLSRTVEQPAQEPVPDDPGRLRARLHRG
jgi:uncharacterized phage-associated protein